MSLRARRDEHTAVMDRHNPLATVRDAGSTHEEYLAAVLEREVSARNASEAAQRIPRAGFRRPVRRLGPGTWQR
jgi:hypothetical protein